MSEPIPDTVMEILPPGKWQAMRFNDVLVCVCPDHPVMVANEIEGRWQVTQIDPSKPVETYYPGRRQYWGDPW